METCLRIQPEEKVTLITDQATAQIAGSLAAELTARAAAGMGLFSRILRRGRWSICRRGAAGHGDLETSASLRWMVQRNELHSRMQMTSVVNRRRMRHAHMVNITPQIMCEGMRADFQPRRPVEPEADREGARGELHSRDDGGGDGHSRRAES